ncbi:MAG: AAA family ATPase [SAR324 cluster bacterium]|nr:AAA family ATPase [SAR324 cluster bacterium]
MSDLILNSLVIENFRILKKLEINPLKRINLLVGENNSGKTTVLEALRFYATRAEFISTWLMLNSRDETSDDNFLQQQSATPIRNIQYLFHRDLIEHGAPQKHLSIGSIDGHKLQMTLSQNILEFKFDGIAHSFNLYDFFLTGINQRYQWNIEQIPVQFIPAQGLFRQNTETLWDNIASTEGEDDILNCLKILHPDIKRINFGKDAEYNTTSRIPIVLLEGELKRRPLRSLGEGLTRLFGLALSMVNAKNGWLLVDEIESGLHYSMQPLLWEYLLTLSSRLNVQIFATTHSWDAIQGLQQAIEKQHQPDAQLIRLRRIQGEICAETFTTEELRIMTRDHLEVR